MPIVHAPKNYLPRIETIWAYLSVDEGGEGVCAAPLEPGMLSVPLLAADETRLEKIRPFALAIAKLTGRPVRLAKFTVREDIEVIQPGDSL